MRIPDCGGRWCLLRDGYHAAKLRASKKAKPLAETPVAHHHAMLKTAHNWALEEELLLVNPALRVKNPPALRPKLRPVADQPDSLRSRVIRGALGRQGILGLLRSMARAVLGPDEGEAAAVFTDEEALFRAGGQADRDQGGTRWIRLLERLEDLLTLAEEVQSVSRATQVELLPCSGPLS